MEKFGESIYRGLGYYITQKFIFIFFMACWAPILAIPLYFLINNRDSEIAQACFMFPLLGALGFSWFFSGKTAGFMIKDNIGLKNAFLHSILPYFSVLEFLPFFDRIREFLHKQNYTNPYTETRDTPEQDNEV
jgi:hypothetical protein